MDGRTRGGDTNCCLTAPQYTLNHLSKYYPGKFHPPVPITDWAKTDNTYPPAWSKYLRNSRSSVWAILESASRKFNQVWHFWTTPHKVSGIKVLVSLSWNKTRPRWFLIHLWTYPDHGAKECFRKILWLLILMIKGVFISIYHTIHTSQSEPRAGWPFESVVRMLRYSETNFKDS